MSFALEYRKKIQQQEHEALAVKKANEGFVSMPAEASVDTSKNRRRVFLALIVAGGVLAVFNSGGLVRYTQGLAGNPVGERLIVMSEGWHEMMQRKQATRVVEEIRGSLSLVREARWRDLTFGFRTGAGEQPLPAMEQRPPPSKPEQREIAKPAAPVMRASVERRP